LLREDLDADELAECLGVDVMDIYEENRRIARALERIARKKKEEPS
jgi:hypothetical protein